MYRLRMVSRANSASFMLVRFCASKLDNLFAIEVLRHQRWGARCRAPGTTPTRQQRLYTPEYPACIPYLHLSFITTSLPTLTSAWIFGAPIRIPTGNPPYRYEIGRAEASADDGVEGGHPERGAAAGGLREQLDDEGADLSLV